MAVKIRSAVKSNVAVKLRYGRTKKSIYGDNFKVVVAEAPATEKSALLMKVEYQGNKCSRDLATNYKSS